LLDWPVKTTATWREMTGAHACNEVFLGLPH
jgi:hypothetical protein